MGMDALRPGNARIALGLLAACMLAATPTRAGPGAQDSPAGDATKSSAPPARRRVSSSGTCERSLP